MIIEGKLGRGWGLRNRRNGNASGAGFPNWGNHPRVEGGSESKGCAGEGGPAGKLNYRCLGGDRKKHCRNGLNSK